jgi:hypothetical protein
VARPKTTVVVMVQRRGSDYGSADHHNDHDGGDVGRRLREAMPKQDRYVLV